MAPWSKETAGVFTLDWFEGGHFFLRLHETEFLAALARHLPTHLSAH
jgi:surfactin synthase thioesterase subunit